jgi:hypothetical protein
MFNFLKKREKEDTKHRSCKDIESLRERVKFLEEQMCHFGNDKKEIKKRKFNNFIQYAKETFRRLIRKENIELYFSTASLAISLAVAFAFIWYNFIV